MSETLLCAPSQSLFLHCKLNSVSVTPAFFGFNFLAFSAKARAVSMSPSSKLEFIKPLKPTICVSGYLRSFLLYSFSLEIRPFALVALAPKRAVI